MPAPTVSPELYDEDYYRHHCGPHETWDAHEGAQIDPYYVGTAKTIGIRAGDRVVDLGTGRGEFLAAALQAGARTAIGIEYSETAVAMAEKTLSAQGVRGRAEVRRGDIRATGLEAESADLVTLLDVVEHMAPPEVHQALAEARRLLAPGGRVLIHTMPNRLVYDVTYRLQRAVWPPRWRRWPRDPRHPLEHDMHVNEMTLGSLRRAIRAADFDEVEAWRGRWVLDHFVPNPRAQRLYHRLASNKLTAPLALSDLWARGSRHPAAR